MMHHRVRKASLINPIFTDQQFDALRSVDAHLGTARMGLKEEADVLANDLKEMWFDHLETKLFPYPVALRVYAEELSGYTRRSFYFSEVSF